MENKKTETTKPRLFFPDLLKGIAVILMIQVHLMEKFATPDVYEGIWGKISLFLGGPPAAPVFMAVMGFFIAFSDKGTRANVVRGIKIIMLGLILNIGLNFHLLLGIFKGTIVENPWHFIFGVDILFLAGLSILLIAVFRLFLKENIIGWFLLMCVFASINPFLPVAEAQNHWLTFVQAFFWGSVEWSYFPVFPWFAYPLAGFIFYLLMEKMNIHKISKTNKLYVGISALLVVLITFGYGLKTSVSLINYYHHPLWFFLWAMAFLLFWIIFIDLIFRDKTGNCFTKYLIWTGKNVTVFYVIQWLIIGNIGTALYRSQSKIQFVIWFVVILAITTMLVWVVNKLKGTNLKTN